jgi:hypothetical protein
MLMGPIAPYRAERWHSVRLAVTALAIGGSAVLIGRSDTTPGLALTVAVIALCVGVAHAHEQWLAARPRKRSRRTQLLTVATAATLGGAAVIGAGATLAVPALAVCWVLVRRAYTHDSAYSRLPWWGLLAAEAARIGVAATFPHTGAAAVLGTWVAADLIAVAVLAAHGHTPATVRRTPGDAAAGTVAAAGLWALITTWAAAAALQLDGRAADDVAIGVGFAALGVAGAAAGVEAARRRGGTRTDVAMRAGRTAVTVGVVIAATAAGIGPAIGKLLLGTQLSLAVSIWAGIAGAAIALTTAATLTMAANRRLAISVVWIAVAGTAVLTILPVNDPELFMARCAATATLTAWFSWVALWKADRGHTGGNSDAAAFLAEPGSCAISVILPAYKTGPEINTVITGVFNALDDITHRSVEVIVVDDGSPTPVSVTHSDPRVRVERYDSNRGKGHAVHWGMRHAHGQIVAFIDSDGDINPALLADMHTALTNNPDLWAAVADRHHPESQTGQSILRVVSHHGFAAITGFLFGLDVGDSQCGAKAFRREPLSRVISHCRETGFIFDLELLAVGADLGTGGVVGVPVSIERTGDSSVTGRTVLTMAAQTVQLWCNLGQRRRQPGENIPEQILT